jgi:hypothetical protein
MPLIFASFIKSAALHFLQQLSNQINCVWVMKKVIFRTELIQRVLQRQHTQRCTLYLSSLFAQQPRAKGKSFPSSKRAAITATSLPLSLFLLLVSAAPINLLTEKLLSQPTFGERVRQANMPRFEVFLFCPVTFSFRMRCADTIAWRAGIDTQESRSAQSSLNLQSRRPREYYIIVLLTFSPDVYIELHH